MNVIVLLLSISFSIAVVFLVLFVWNVKSGQYDDAQGPSMRVLFGEKGRERKAVRGSDGGLKKIEP